MPRPLRDDVVAHQRRVEDRVLREEGVLVGAELRADVVNAGDELALHLVDEIEQSVAIEVHPDEGAGDAALVAREAADVRAAEGVDRCLLAGNAVRCCSRTERSRFGRRTLFIYSLDYRRYISTILQRPGPRAGRLTRRAL